MAAWYGSETWALDFEEDPSMGSDLKCHEFVEGWRAWLLVI